MKCSANTNKVFKLCAFIALSKEKIAPEVPAKIARVNGIYTYMQYVEYSNLGRIECNSRNWWFFHCLNSIRGNKNSTYKMSFKSVYLFRISTSVSDCFPHRPSARIIIQQNTPTHYLLQEYCHTVVLRAQFTASGHFIWDITITKYFCNPSYNKAILQKYLVILPNP